MSSPYGHLLIDLSLRTDNRLFYCTDSGSMASNCFLSERLKQSSSLVDQHRNSLYPPSVPIGSNRFPANAKVTSLNHVQNILSGFSANAT